MLVITNHRRFTANHTWHVNWGGRSLFVKANPHPDEASAERAGHARLQGLYPIPRLRGARRVGHWTVLAYDRWPHLGHNTGLLLDEITRADLTHDTRRLDECLTAVFGHYQRVIGRTLRRTTNDKTICKLYGDRATVGGRLDHYYISDEPWPISANIGIRPSELADLRLVINGNAYEIDFAEVVKALQVHFAGQNPAWAGVTQGDPTDINIGWSPAGGPVWFDYDTAGLNALPGEFACFLIYQRLHGAWLTPHYNGSAFRDHPQAITTASLAEPVVQVQRDGSSVRIDYRHAPSPARQHVLRRYLDELVHPVAERLGVGDLMAWLRSYLVMRLLAVYNLADLEPRDTALSLALTAQALHPGTTLPDFLAVSSSRAATVAPVGQRGSKEAT